jgi:diadenosine tetraphosphate (Ap4A) HIT family hydrolase
MSRFTLDERLKNDGFEVIDLPLCKVILVDNANFPWVILVPRVNNITEIIDLNEKEQMNLMQEICLVLVAMKEIFNPDKLNMAAFGNIVPQLHIHIIARYKSDIAFPQPTFGHKREPYEERERLKLIEQIKAKLK